MFHRVFQRLFLVLLACLLSGGHWAVLQSVAWTGMLVRYTAEGDLESGIRRTFDGQNPCDMCRAIKEARSAESDPSEAPATLSRDEFRLAGLAPEADRARLRAPTRFAFPARELSAARHLRDAPPVPPPRLAA